MLVAHDSDSRLGWALDRRKLETDRGFEWIATDLRARTAKTGELPEPCYFGPDEYFQHYILHKGGGALMIAPELPMSLSRRLKARTPVTVCVAAIFESTGIIGASDRMLTAGDVQFEPQMPKVRFFSNSISGLIAGDANLQAEIVSEVIELVRQRIEKTPAEWVPVKEVARFYKKVCDTLIGEMAERRILTPFGLTRQEFLARQREFSTDFVKDIAHELLNFESPYVEIIIAGIDATGPHIYTVSSESMQCHDTVGFAAIGAGQAHANSQMMAFNHTLRHSLADTLRAVFFAKKRAEIAPGVGPDTDMIVAAGVGRLALLADNVQAELEKRYAEEKRKQTTVANSTRKKINLFVQGILDTPASSDQAQLPSTTDGDSSSSVETPKA